MPSGGKRSAVVEAPSRSSLPLHRPRSTTEPRSPVKRVSAKAFPTRFQGGDDSLSVVQDFDDVLASGGISGHAVSESQKRQPGIAKSMKTKAQSKAVSKKRKKDLTSDAPARGAEVNTTTPPVDEESVLIAPTARHQAAVAHGEALQKRTNDTFPGSDKSRTSLDPPPGPTQLQDQAAHRATGLARPLSPALATSIAHATSVETPVPHERSSLRRRILAPETPLDSSRSGGSPHTPSRPRVGLQVESTGSKKARQTLPLGEDVAGDIRTELAPHEGSNGPRSPLAERSDENRPAVSTSLSLPGERRGSAPVEAELESDLRQSPQPQTDSPPRASQSSLHCIVYCWHRDSQSSSQMQGQSFSQSQTTQPQAYSASQHSQSQFLSQPQPLSQQSSIGVTHDGERGVGFFEGMEEQPWVRIGVDQVVELTRGGCEERGKTILYQVAKGPPTRREVAVYCDWRADKSDS